MGSWRVFAIGCFLAFAIDNCGNDTADSFHLFDWQLGNMKPEPAFFVEPLERRFMFSSNVIATLIGVDLWAWGDEFENDLSLEVVENQTVLIGSSGMTSNGSSNSFVMATRHL